MIQEMFVLFLRGAIIEAQAGGRVSWVWEKTRLGYIELGVLDG